MAEKGQLGLMEVKFWLKEAESCVERQRQELLRKNNYPFLINYYEGVETIDASHPHVSANNKMAIINEFFPNTNSLISDIMYQNPDILLEALKPQAEEDLPIMKAALQRLFDKTDALIENRIALFDMFYAGYCAVEVDILPKDEREEPIAEPPQEGTPDQRESIFDKAVKGLKKTLDIKDAEDNFAKLSPPIESNFATVQGTYIRRYNPLDVPLDWRAERIRDRRYNLKKVWMSKSEFDAKYKKFKDYVGAEQAKYEDSKFLYSQHDLDVHTQKVLLYEFQVRLRGGQYQTIIICPQLKTREIDTFIRPYTTNGFNMKIGTLHKYGKLYPISIAQVNKTMQDELNRYVKFMMDVTKRNIPKRVYDRNKVKGDALEALTNTNINEYAPVDGNVANVIQEVQPTQISFDNKDLIAIFQDQKTKLWAVSEPRISGNSTAKFATELAIQEQGFQSKNIDVQEGLRLLIKDELETGKDLIVTFWDEEIFLKVTGHSKMDWYEPSTAPDPNNPDAPMILNPLAELLTGDYSVDIDIASSARPNREQQLSRMFYFMNNLVAARQILIDQGKDINLEEIQRVSKEFGWNPDKLFVDYQPAQVPAVPTAGGETISPEEDAARQAEAEARAGGQV